MNKSLGISLLLSLNWCILFLDKVLFLTINHSIFPNNALKYIQGWKPALFSDMRLVTLISLARVIKVYNGTVNEPWTIADQTEESAITES